MLIRVWVTLKRNKTTESKYRSSERHRRHNGNAVMCQSSIQNELLFRSYTELIAVNKKRAAKIRGAAHNAEVLQE